MELSQKTTILFPPDLHERLVRLAKERRTSLGQLVREACAEQYGIAPREDRLAAARAIRDMALPVATVAEMKRQSIAPPRRLER